MFCLYMVDSTQESITTQTVSLSHVKKKQFDAKIISLLKTPHESQLRLQTVSSSHVKQKKI